MNSTSFASDPTQGWPRRDALFGMGTGLGSVALTALLADEPAAANPLAARPGQHRAKATRCIF